MKKSRSDFVRGVFFTKLDDKNRVKVPKDMVDIIRIKDQSCVLMIMPDPCLSIYAENVWHNIWVKTFQDSEANPVSRGRRELSRILGANSKTFKLEGQGRVTLQEHFQKHAGLEKGKEIAIIGAENRIEIWDRDKWQSHSSKITKKFEDIVENL